MDDDDGWPPPLYPSSSCFNNLFNAPPPPFTEPSSLNSNNNLSSHSHSPIVQHALAGQEPPHHQLVDNQDINWVSLFSGGSGCGDQECSTTSTNVSKATRSGAERSGEGDQIEAPPVVAKGRVGLGRRGNKKVVPPRVAFHTRSANDILDDGYKWRKYGQKAVKNSMYPRSYYHCTRHTCNVKKQIQRLMKDPSIVVTTYEGHHNHPCEQLMETLSPLLKQIQFLAKF